VTQAPLSNFKKLIVTIQTLLRGLHRECEQIKLREPPPVPYMPVKDEVQDEVARMRSMEIKSTIKKDTMLNFSVWQENGTCEAFLMHVTAVSDAIKKRGQLDDYEKAAWKYGKAKEVVESARAGLLLLLGESVRKSSKDKKDQERREGGSSEGNVLCVLNQEFLFLVHKYWGSEATCLS
jgi:hypothetical protein